MSQPTDWGVPRDAGDSGTPYGMTALMPQLDEVLDADLSSHSGSTAPAYAVAGTLWLDTSSSPYVLKLYSGTAWGSIGRIDPTTGAWTRAIYQFLAGPIPGGLTFPSGANTLITYTEATDPFGVYASGVFTAPVDGMYHFSATGYLPTQSSDFFSGLRLYFNGTTVLRRSGTHYGTIERAMAGSWEANLTAGDTVSVRMFHGLGSTISTNLQTTDGSLWNFSGYLVS